MAKRIARTTAVRKIEDSKGKFFTATWETRNGNERTINCNYKAGSTTRLGYMRVYSPKDKGYRSIDPRTLKEVKMEGIIYKIRK